MSSSQTSTPEIRRYAATVTVHTDADGEEVAEVSPFHQILVDGPAQEPIPTVHIYFDQIAELEFSLDTEGFRFPRLDPRSMTTRIGPFAFAYGDDSNVDDPQHRFQFVKPPALEVSLDDDAQPPRARLRLANLYTHDGAAFTYRLEIYVERATGEADPFPARWPAIAPGDPTIIEDSDPPPPRSRG